MAYHFNSADTLDAWRQVSTHLLANGTECYDVLVSISNPNVLGKDWLERFNPHALASNFDPVRDVANTIFPFKTRLNSKSRNELYDRYKVAYDRRRRHHPGVWGTYFYRLIAFGDKKINQLDRAILAMRDWEHNHKSVVVLHTSSAETDGVRTRGGPCLQYVQLNCPTASTVNMVAVYRNHDYFNKAFGNFVGLGRLLAFIAEETNRKVGTLTCLSSHAYFDVSRTNLQSLLAR